MKALSQPIVGVTIAVLLTAIATSPSNAARRAQTEIVVRWNLECRDLYIKGRLRLYSCCFADYRRPCVFRGLKLSSIRCGWRRGRSPRNSRQGEPVGIWLRSTVE